MFFILQIVLGARSHGSKLVLECKVVEVRSLCSEFGVEREKSELQREAQAEPLQDVVRVLPTLLHFLPRMETNL